jgi:hypothetical protein
MSFGIKAIFEFAEIFLNKQYPKKHIMSMFLGLVLLGRKPVAHHAPIMN